MKKLKLLAGMIRQEFLRVITGWRIYLCIIVYIVVCFLICEQEGTTHATWSVGHIVTLSNISFLLVVVASFPFACSFCDDWLGCYYRPAIARGGSSNYILSKIVVCVFFSFLVSFIGIFTFACIRIYFYGYNFQGYSYVSYVKIALDGHPILYFLTISFVYALVTPIYAIFGMAMSAVLPNRFVSAMAPLFSCIIIQDITENFPKFLRTHSIGQGSDLFNLPIVPSLLFTIMVTWGYILIGAVVFAKVAGGRIRNEIV